MVQTSQGQCQLKLDPKPGAQVHRTTWARKRLKIIPPWLLGHFLLKENPRVSKSP